MHNTVNKNTYLGGCHCSAVRLKVTVSGEPTLYECNCSICEQVGFLHLIVRATEFELLKGQQALTLYRFNTGLAQHWFCRHCGVKPYYIPRSHPDGYSINARCLDGRVWRQWPQQPFDGRNWEQALNTLD